MHKRYTHKPKVQAIESNPQKIKKPKKDAQYLYAWIKCSKFAVSTEVDIIRIDYCPLNFMSL